MSITEKLAYIKGLCEGLKLDDSTKEGKILLAIVDLLDDVTEEVASHDGDIDQIFDELDRVYDEIDAIDEDLTDIEESLLDEDDEDDDEDDDGYDDEEWDLLEDGDEDITDLYDEDNPLYEITCPKCGETVCMDEDMLFSSDCACPNCGTIFEVDYDDDEEEEETEE